MILKITEKYAVAIVLIVGVVFDCLLGYWIVKRFDVIPDSIERAVTGMFVDRF